MWTHNNMNKVITIIKVLVSSLSVYYLFCISVEEIFWLVCGVMAGTYYVLEKDAAYRGGNVRQRIVFGMVGCYISLCLTAGLYYYEQIHYETIQWIVILTGLFILFYEGLGYLYQLCDRIPIRQFGDKTGNLRGGGGGGLPALAFCSLQAGCPCSLPIIRVF